MNPSGIFQHMLARNVLVNYIWGPLLAMLHSTRKCNNTLTKKWPQLFFSITSPHFVTSYNAMTMHFFKQPNKSIVFISTNGL
jgi:hypothetical protein